MSKTTAVHNTVSACRRRMDCILDLLTHLGTTNNYSATADLHTSQFTTAPVKPFPACYVLTNRSLATEFNSGNSSASLAQVLLSQTFLNSLNHSAISSQPPLQTLTSTAEPQLTSQLSSVRIKVRVTLRLTAANQFVFATKTLRVTTTDFFSTEPLWP
jgi:hypothetical protein